MSDTSEPNGDFVLCMGERAYYPLHEFKVDQDDHPWIHDTEYRHYVSDGALVEPGGEYQGLGVLFGANKTDPGHHAGGLGIRAREGSASIRPRLGEHYLGVAGFQARPDLLHTLRDVLHEPDAPKGPPQASPGVPQPEKQGTLADDLLKASHQALLDEAKAERDAQRQMIKDAQAYDYTRGQALYSAHLAVAQGQIDRAQARAALVIQAASAIGTLYAAILGLDFGLGGGANKAVAPLPIRGIVPAVFLGIAIFAAALYLAYLTSLGTFRDAKPSGLLSYRLIEQADDFTRWTARFVSQRLPWLHAAVICLGFGVLFLPVAFLDLADLGVLIAGGVALVLVFIMVFWLESARNKNTE